MKVHLECLPDETLAMALGVSRKNIKHHAGNGRVCAELEKLEGKIGLIDEEPGKPQANHRFLKELVFVEEKYGIRKFEDKKRKHSVIMLCPEFEGWIVEVAIKQKINLKKDFGLEDSARTLHGVINQRLLQLTKLIKHLEKEQNQAILHLKNLLNS